MKWNPHRIAQSLGGIVMVIAAVSLTGHATGHPELSAWSSARVTMKVETTWLLWLLAAALAEVARGRPQFARGTVFAAYGTALWIAGVYWNLWEPLCSGAECNPAAPLHLGLVASPLTAIFGLFDATALLATTYERRRLARWMELGSVVLAAIVFGLHGLGVDTFYEWTGANGVALSTATGFSLLTLGTFLVAFEDHMSDFREHALREARLRELERRLDGLRERDGS